MSAPRVAAAPTIAPLKLGATRPIRQIGLVVSGTSAPHRFGRYELIERIGTGGMAEVFRARALGPLGFQRELVVKRIRPEYAEDSMIIQMFSEEAKLAACATHRNIVQVFELGATETGEVFMAMEHVAGTDLKEVQLRAFDHDRRIPPWFSVHVVAEVLDGLSFMHGLVDSQGRRRNIVHRDVSPENIFISNLGDVKLGDFGIAKDDTRPDALHGREVKGKPGYSAPEHVSGSIPDQRFDVFSAGVVLWECLTQRPLLSGSNMEAVLEADMPELRTPPSRYTRDVPPELDALVLRALSPNPEARTATTQAMRRELLDVLEHLRPGRIDPAEIGRVFTELVALDADRRSSAAAAECERDVRGAPRRVEGAEEGARGDIDDLEPSVEALLDALMEPAIEPMRKRFEDGRTYAFIARAKPDKTQVDPSQEVEPRIRRLVI